MNLFTSKLILAVILAGIVTPGLSLAQTGPLPSTKAAEGAEVYIESPRDGATVGQDFIVRFGLEGMGIAPAGVEHPDTGHHHLLVDVTTLPAAGTPIPKDAQHLHFGGGQTEAKIHLTPGTHTLQLELADANHVPFSPALVSKKITVHVK